MTSPLGDSAEFHDTAPVFNLVDFSQRFRDICVEMDLTHNCQWCQKRIVIPSKRTNNRALDGMLMQSLGLHFPKGSTYSRYWSSKSCEIWYGTDNHLLIGFVS